MYRPNRLKERLSAGHQAIGCWLQMASPIAAEIVGRAGFDCVVIDHEHGPGSLMDAIGEMQAISAFETTAMMRVPWNDPVYIKRALDSGVEAVMVPSVNTAEEAKRAVAACRYPTAGFRGVAFGATRFSDYGASGAEAARLANERTLVMLQIETRRAVENIEEIASVEGIDILFVGPTDLSSDIGYIGRATDPEPQALIQEAVDRIKRAGKKVSSIVIPGRTAEQMLDQGFDLVLVASDVGLLRDNAYGTVARLRDRLS